MNYITYWSDGGPQIIQDEIKFSDGGVNLVATHGRTITNDYVLIRGIFDLAGQTLICTRFLSSYTSTRELKDTAGGGKIIVNGLTGTIFNMGTTTGLTVSNAPDVQVGDSTKTLTANVTLDFGGKTFGDLAIQKHAGDFDYIIGGSNDATFGAITVETPDATYPYSDTQITVDKTVTCTGLTCDGTSDYQIDLKGTADHATLSCASGTITVTYTDVENLQATGGATFYYGTGSTITGDTTGWTAPGGGGGGPAVMGVANPAAVSGVVGAIEINGVTGG